MSNECKEEVGGALCELGSLRISQMVKAMLQELGIREVANLRVEQGACWTLQADMRTHSKGCSLVVSYICTGELNIGFCD